MNNKPTLNHHHQTALLYLYNNPNQPAFTGPNNQALNELRQMGYVKAKKFENWAGTGSCKFEWYLTKAGIERVEVGILGKCTTCNGSGQVWINEWMQKPIEDNPQIIPKFEKTDANRLADAIEEIARLEKALEESEKRGAELAASYCDGVVGDEHGHAYCRYKVERDAALAEVNRLRESKGDPSGSFDRCVKMMYERDENAKRLDAALARIAELEGKLTDWVHEGFRLNEALAVAKAQPSVPEGWKLVPMDPTSQMTSVGQSLRYEAVNSIGEIYRQMLAVAPSPIDPAAHPQPCQQPQAHPARCGCER
ncbi:phage protein [Pseudomonas phage PA01]|uniref:Phage protein n=1 Tax=Pseudomonas phage PA01 TaxID=2498591 RepID=A0A455VYD0_9CAUD|nr:phage protein [Pseudomonas phage PA01]BBI98273.1 phage protein [Pseudomonas phage PA01]